MPVPRDRRHEGRYWNLLDKAERAVLLELGRLGVFQPGDVLCTEGEQTTHVFVLMTGWVKISSAADGGREQVLGLRGGGDIIGELAAESDGFRTATVKAISTVQALIIPDDRFSQFLDAHRGADHAYRTILTRRWGEAADILRSRSVSSGPQRLAAYLIDLAERYGTPGNSGIDITIPLSQEEIASIVGVSRATATRALSDWRRRGLIRTSRHRLAITNITLLHRIAHREPRSFKQERLAGYRVPQGTRQEKQSGTRTAGVTRHADVSGGYFGAVEVSARVSGCGYLFIHRCATTSLELRSHYPIR